MSVKPVLTVVGGGMGDPALLTVAARAAIQAAERIYTAPRLADSLLPLNPRVQAASTGEILAALAGELRDATVVVSGDTGFFSLSSTLERKLSGLYQMKALGGLSSLQYLCGKRYLPYHDVRPVSLHGRGGGILGAVSYGKRTFVLTGGENGAGVILRQLADCGLGAVTVTVGENLSSAGERITTATAAELAEASFSDLAVLLVENPAAADPHVRLRDEDFLRGEIPMTKEAVRTLSVARLAVKPGHTVWDIGAGTGSVSVALAYAAHDGMVYAVERSSTALELIRQNRMALGAYNLAVVEAEAPDGLSELPPPDKVFIGGSGGGMEAILTLLCKISDHFDVCLNAITLESVSEAMDCLNRLGFTGVEVQCVNVSAAKTVGGYHMMMAQNPVYIISGGRHCER